MITCDNPVTTRELKITCTEQCTDNKSPTISLDKIVDKNQNMRNWRWVALISSTYLKNNIKITACTCR